MSWIRDYVFYYRETRFASFVRILNPFWSFIFLRETKAYFGISFCLSLTAKEWWNRSIWNLTSSFRWPDRELEISSSNATTQNKNEKKTKFYGKYYDRKGSWLQTNLKFVVEFESVFLWTYLNWRNDVDIIEEDGFEVREVLEQRCQPLTILQRSKLFRIELFRIRYVYQCMLDSRASISYNHIQLTVIEI